jgi:hypothetical protein
MLMKIEVVDLDTTAARPTSDIIKREPIIRPSNIPAITDYYRVCSIS